MRGIKLTQQQFIERACKIHGDKYDYTKSIYVRMIRKIIITCRKHGDFEQRPIMHLKGRGCKLCADDRQCSTIKEFKKKSIKVHGNIYDYSLVDYKTAADKVIIICVNHGQFIQSASNHLQGHGCPQCANEDQAFSKDEFINKASNIHNNFYNYIDIIYKNNSTKINIICPIHQLFIQTPRDHLMGRGCPKCGREKATDARKTGLEEFIIQANIIHNNLYDYSNAIYVNCKIKITIICTIHGKFEQTPDAHLNGKQGCPRCTRLKSKVEIMWLDYLNVPEEFRNKNIKINGKLFYPDAIDLENKIIYEFYGDFWHGNPQRYDLNKINSSTKKTFGQLYEKTMKKEKYLTDHGYKIISIWESDFNKIIKKSKL